MNTIKLIAIDLDETLLNQDREISEFTASMIDQLCEMNYMILPSTARSYKDIPSSLMKTNLEYYVCSNGATIWNNRTKSIISSHVLSMDMVKEILNHTAMANKIITMVADGIIYTDKKFVDLLKLEKLDEENIARICSTRTMVDVDDFSTILEKHSHIDKLHFNFMNLDEKEICSKLVDCYSDQINITSSDPTNLEMTNKLASKGLAIKELCKIMNIDEDCIMAIGDNTNDIAMFEVAKIKVAMKNGNPILKEKADYITEYSNIEDGVAKFLQKHLIQ